MLVPVTLPSTLPGPGKGAWSPGAGLTAPAFKEFKNLHREGWCPESLHASFLFHCLSGPRVVPFKCQPSGMWKMGFNYSSLWGALGLLEKGPLPTSQRRIQREGRPREVSEWLKVTQLGRCRARPTPGLCVPHTLHFLHHTSWDLRPGWETGVPKGQRSERKEGTGRLRASPDRKGHNSTDPRQGASLWLFPRQL